jgi:hypothetical protein
VTAELQIHSAAEDSYVTLVPRSGGNHLQFIRLRRRRGGGKQCVTNRNSGSRTIRLHLLSGIWKGDLHITVRTHRPPTSPHSSSLVVIRCNYALRTLTVITKRVAALIRRKRCRDTIITIIHIPRRAVLHTCTTIFDVRFQAFTEVTMKNAVFLDVTSGGSCGPHGVTSQGTAFFKYFPRVHLDETLQISSLSSPSLMKRDFKTTSIAKRPDFSTWTISPDDWSGRNRLN